MAVYKFNQPVAFDGNQTEKTVNTSGQIADATQALWTLYDLEGSEIVGAVAPVDTGSVLLTVAPAPPAGSYQLVGIQ